MKCKELYFQNNLTYMKIFVSLYLIDFYLELLSTDKVLNSVVQ